MIICGVDVDIVGAGGSSILGIGRRQEVALGRCGWPRELTDPSPSEIDNYFGDYYYYYFFGLITVAIRCRAHFWHWEKGGWGWAVGQTVKYSNNIEDCSIGTIIRSIDVSTNNM